MSANARFKDSLFTFLFSEPDVLRDLYSALEGVSLPTDVPVTINTLEDVLFMGRVNDISFEIGGKLVVLIEHHAKYLCGVKPHRLLKCGTARAPANSP